MKDTGPPIVTVPNVTVNDLQGLRQTVSRFARQAGLAVDRVAHLALAATEIVSNAIQHGPGTANVTIRASPASVIVEVEDSGPGIPDGVTVSMPEPDALRGRGLWLARELCDRVDIVTGQAGTQVRLIMAVGPR